MKRLIAAIIAVLLALALTAALAEGKLTVTQENFYVLGRSSYYGYLFARVDNTGDAPVMIKGGRLDIFDANGELLAYSDFPTRIAEYLQPGEYTYICFAPQIKDIQGPEDVADHKLTLEPQHGAANVSFRLPTESAFEPGVQDGSFTRDYLTTTLTNDADQTAFDVSIGRVLLDAEGNILAFDHDSMYSYKGITPGSSIVYRRQLGKDFADYIAAHDIRPASVDAIAYVNIKEPGVYTRGETVKEETAKEETVETAAEPEKAEPAYETLKKGSAGDAVRALQQRLKDLGYLRGDADGAFGKGTAKAVSAFQKSAGLEATGIADAATQAALFADDIPAK